jgi:hypothetical protein
MGKAYANWLDKLESAEVFTENDVIYLRKAIGYSGLADEGQRHALKYELYKRLSGRGIRLTLAQQRKGTEYLLGKSLRKDGKPRKGCKLNAREIAILQSRNVTHRWVDIYPQANGFGKVLGYLPVYRAEAGADSFDYVGTVYDLMTVVIPRRR